MKRFQIPLAVAPLLVFGVTALQAQVTPGGPQAESLTRATVSATISQSSSSANAFASQTVAIGSVLGDGTGRVATDAQLLGSLTQISEGAQGNPKGQEVRVATVFNAAGAGVLTASGLVAGPVNQVATGPGGVFQLLSVATVSGSSPSDATARVVMLGEVTQDLSSPPPSAGNQNIRVGDIGSRAGRASTGAVVGASLSQSLSGTSSFSEQQVAIATVGFSGASRVSTRAVLQGSVAQMRTGGRGGHQTIEIGSASGGLGSVVSTDATVDANLLQAAADKTSSNHQTIQVGVVSQGGADQ